MGSKNRLIALVCLLVSVAAAQVPDYQGPGVTNRGAGDIGTRNGPPIDLRLYGAVSGVFDSNIQPVALDSQGNLVRTGDLYGVELGFGAYGVHNFKNGTLGLDYHGTVRHYNSNSVYDGSDQTLSLGYSYRQSRRIVLDFRQLGGLVSLGGVYEGLSQSSSASVAQPTSVLLDSRYSYLQSTVDANYIATMRTIFTVGGDVFFQRYQSSALQETNGYDFRGSVEYRLSRTSSIGATYVYSHFSFPSSSGASDANQGQGFYSRTLGPRWVFSIHAGAYLVETKGLQQVKLDPTLAKLFHRTIVIQPFYVKSTLPSGNVTLTRKFKEALFNISYVRMISSGNGVYLTSRSESGYGTFTYTGVRKFNLSVRGGYSSLSSIGTSLQRYQEADGGLGLSYQIMRATHIVSRFDVRQQLIDLAGYRRTGSRVTVGLAFSPGNIPLSLW